MQQDKKRKEKRKRKEEYSDFVQKNTYLTLLGRSIRVLSTQSSEMDLVSRILLKSTTHNQYIDTGPRYYQEHPHRPTRLSRQFMR